MREQRHRNNCGAAGLRGEGKTQPAFPTPRKHGKDNGLVGRPTETSLTLHNITASATHTEHNSDSHPQPHWPHRGQQACEAVSQSKKSLLPGQR